MLVLLELGVMPPCHKMVVVVAPVIVADAANPPVPLTLFTTAIVIVLPLPSKSEAIFENVGVQAVVEPVALL